MYNGDSVIAITKTQMADANKQSAELRECKRITENYELQINGYKALYNNCNELSSKHELQIDNLQKQLGLKDGIIATNTEQINYLNKTCRNRKWLIIALTGLSSALAIVAIVK